MNAPPPPQRLGSPRRCCCRIPIIHPVLQSCNVEFLERAFPPKAATSGVGGGLCRVWSAGTPSSWGRCGPTTSAGRSSGRSCPGLGGGSPPPPPPPPPGSRASGPAPCEAAAERRGASAAGRTCAPSGSAAPPAEPPTPGTGEPVPPRQCRTRNESRCAPHARAHHCAK